ncbi:hypothetical protein TWF506_004695 [Arthrobotrys conoides]|uniref:Cell wall protein n=1 Tax=Arthrobotrys conoides TaxID=74498 RepID=A0AAN8NF74_9PEZI
MHIRVLLVLYSPLLALSIPTSLPFLRFDTFQDFLDDLFTLRTEIQTQKIRSDLTDSYIKGLIQQAEGLEAVTTDQNGNKVPPFGLVAKAVKYFDLVRTITKDFPADISASLEFIKESDASNLGDIKEIIDTATEEQKQAEFRAEQFENDLDQFGTPPSNGEILADDDEFHTPISDPGFDFPLKYANQVAGIPRITWGDEGPIRQIEHESGEQQETRDPRFDGVVRNLYEEEFKEEEMDQNSDTSADPESPRWYQNFLGPEDGFFDDSDAPAGV